MTTEDVRSFTLFYYFAFLDERRANEAILQSVQQFKQKQKRNPEINPQTLLVQITNSMWFKLTNHAGRGKPLPTSITSWTLPEGFDLGPWREFQKTASDDELLTVIWSRILKFDEAAIADGLVITPGTIRYRLGRAFRKLGGMALGVYRKPL